MSCWVLAPGGDAVVVLSAVVRACTAPAMVETQVVSSARSRWLDAAGGALVPAVATAAACPLLVIDRLIA